MVRGYSIILCAILLMSSSIALGAKKKKKKKPSANKPTSSQIATSESFNPIEIKLSGGYFSSATMNDLGDLFAKSGATVEDGFPYTAGVALHYYLNPRFNILGEFSYSNSTKSLKMDALGIQYVAEIGATIMNFSAGVAYVYDLGIPVNFGASLGYHLLNIKSASNAPEDEESEAKPEESFSGVGFSVFINPQYRINPKMSIGIEPRLFLSFASILDEDDPELSDEDKEENDTFGACWSISLTFAVKL